MAKQTRREILKGSLALAGLSVFGVPEWALPALAEGETVVPFTDVPANANFTPAPDRRNLDIRTIEGPFTPKDGLVERPLSLSLDDLKKMRNAELIAGFECSGNRRPLQGLSSNGRWSGVPLKNVLDSAGVKSNAREFVFYGADHGKEEVEFRTQKYDFDYQFGRSLPREKALSPDPFLAWGLNGEPLTRFQGSPLRLLVPGWYGVCNVKWLSQIHAQEEQYLGKYQARWYRTVRGEMIDGEMRWNETAVTHMQLKSFIARVTRDGNRYKVLGVVLNDGTPIKSVEVSVDEGPWQAAALDSATNSKYSWKLFTYIWTGATPGEHTLVSRVTDATGKVQPTEKDLENKKSFLEDNSQHPRKVMIS